MATEVLTSHAREVAAYLFRNQLNQVVYEEFEVKLNKGFKGKLCLVLNANNKEFVRFMKANDLHTDREAIIWKKNTRSDIITLFPSCIFRDAFKILFKNLEDEEFYQTFEKKAREDLLNPVKQAFFVTKEEEWVPYDIGQKKVLISSYGVLKYSSGEYGSMFEPVAFKGDALYRIDTESGRFFGEVKY